MKKKRPPFFWTIVILAIFAVFSWSAAAFFYFTQKQFVNKAVKTQGRIIAYKKQRKVYRPVIQYITAKKDTIIHTAALGKTDTTLIPKGGSLNLLYLPQKPQIVKVNDFWQLWFQPLVIGGFGSAPLLFILFLRWVLVPKNHAQPEEKRNT
ncbi:DUF3592 domain-containing protein [uncultured Microscilla sp.]|uniref:DUF3592 domain-containing protein n=1 Tax=uncultured Microscilla sp. TaxID=432653 RepID=UPI002609D9DA|nr:DUF3592 domain-containing protein [uncultured Microscilla sp.]